MSDVPETLEYFAEPFTCIDEVYEKHGKIYDATTLQKIADCPRKFEIYVKDNLTRPNIPPPLAAGVSVHSALEYYYSQSTRDEEVEARACAIAGESWLSFDVDTDGTRYEHMTSDFFEELIANYFYYYKYMVVETFHPVILSYEDLNLSQVVAAKFKLNSDGNIILGESNVIMSYDIGYEEPLVLAGKPDLPVRSQNGKLYIMDHKSTSGNLSDYWARSFMTSNQLLGYMAMVGALMNEVPHGFVVNGILTSKYANNVKSKATKFMRIEQVRSEAQYTEALLNQWAWQETIKHYDKLGYYPMGCGYSGCSAPDICTRSEEDREYVLLTEYVNNDRTFWSL